jgi:LCP family protein required for cell wall assembly
MLGSSAPDPRDRPYQRHGRPPRRRVGRRLLIGGLVLLLAAGGTGLYGYRQLNGNIRQVPLYAGTTGDAGTEKPDVFGRVPINVLVIGSDSRAKKANCKLGGACDGTGQNADVEMVVHVSADRTNITVMSVPRDTVAELPGCTDRSTGKKVPARYGQINATLTHGPGCTVAAVHHLTGIPIDHFVMVDFAGVIAMSDSVGGVSVCVSDNVYDPYSHLKLTRGRHVLKGLAALQFVRSRHAFGDGSDLGRTYAQHVFLSAVIRSLKRKGVLLNPASVYQLAQAATKALTVDTGLGSIPKLLGLTADVNKVDPDRITFTTMQTAADPADVNRVVVAAGAKELFQTIIDDQSLTVADGSAATPSPTPAPSITPTADPAGISVRVVNASGTDGRATTVGTALTEAGFRHATLSTSATTVERTTVEYGPGRRLQAQTVAGALGLPAGAVRSGRTPGISLRIGSDWTRGAKFPSRSSSEAARRKAALGQAHAQTATTSSCVPVSRQRTVTVNGIPMTPIRAFDQSPDVRLSAR